METDRPPNTKAKLTEVNSHLTCPLCKGYYIDATTIVECLHSFCRSCIIQHLQQESYCPICELMINTVKPNIKPDKTLQDIVYKLVPELYASEMARRRRFWAERPEEASKVACPEARGLMTERIIFSPQDAISLSIEYTSDEPTAWQRSEPDPEVPLRRYLQCPAMLRVEHLKKFICNKYNVDNLLYHIDILYKRVPLPDHYTLIDIAYIYSWKRNEPMKFFFRITDIALVSERFDYFEPSLKHSTPISRCHQPSRISKQQIINNNNIEKKPSPLGQLGENKEKSSAAIKTCDSVNKQTEKISESSDKRQCSVKNIGEVVKRNNIKRCEKSSCKKDPREIVNDKLNEKDNNSNKKISEISAKNNTRDNKISCGVRVQKDSEEDKKNDSNKSLKNTTERISKTNNSKTDNDPKVPINNKTKNSRINSELSTINESEKSENPENLDINSEKSQFLMSIQLTAINTSPPIIKNTSPSALKPINPDFFNLKNTPQKRKNSRKNDKSAPFPKKTKLDESIETVKRTFAKSKKNNSKEQKTSESDSGVKVKNIKDPIVRLMVSNLNKQATNLTKIVGQTDSSKSNNPLDNSDNQNEQLQSLIDSCKLSIPSSLSITLTESPRNEDGTIVQLKPSVMKPVQNYIEILKLPDKNISSENAENSTEISTETSIKSDAHNKNVPSSPLSRNNQKHTFQTMFEETIKRDESMKAQLFHIQTQAKTLEMAKKASSSIKINIPKTTKKQQSNALDLSTTSPKSETSSQNNSSLTSGNNTNSSTANTTVSQNVTNVSGQKVSPTAGSNGTNPNKRNILEIAHQLSKRSKIESETLKISNSISPNPTVNSNSDIINSKCKPNLSDSKSPKPKDEVNSSNPSQQIIINNNFSSGGCMSINRSPKKIAIPRLPIAKVPTPKLNPPNLNGGLLKFSNYTAKLANSSANNPSKLPNSPASSNHSKTENNKIHGLTPNQILEKYNITNLAQFNANLNQAQMAFQQALMVSHQLELHRIQQNSQKQHWMNNPNMLAHYENYVQSLKNQQNQIVGNSSKN